MRLQSVLMLTLYFDEYSVSGSHSDDIATSLLSCLLTLGTESKAVKNSLVKDLE